MCGHPHYRHGSGGPILDRVKTFLVESYLPRDRAGELDDAIARLQALDTDGAARYLATFYVADDEVCYHLFEARSALAVREAAGPLVTIDHIGEADPRRGA